MRAADGSQIGFGMATAVYPAGQQKAGATAILNKDGTVVVRSATHEIGTGTYTGMSQFAADTLGIPIEKIRFELGDSQFPYAPNNGGSWLTASVAPAVMGACTELKKKVVDIAGSWPNDSMQLTNLFERSRQEQIQAEFNSEPNREEREKFSFFSYGAIFIEVRVDPFGQVRVKRAVGVYDMGRMINPRLARSQILGGMLFGFSTALMEATVPDANVGRIVNPNLAEYHVAVHADTPPEFSSELGLTTREGEVLSWLSKGKTNRDIAQILGLSPRTVDKHLEQIYSKLGVENRTAAAAIAVKTRNLKQ